ncbi:MAG: dNTP triphosphohydrolase [Saprospiraceae bacterium]|nr:dNTP triphosphohydrolase [Saprospiraceae bacterium]
MMNWINCISARRTGYTYTTSANIRSDYQRDYDRLIFSSAFRRLQNKTQVFPLPGSSTFVHNRLTHSLEVASVGRSLGSEVGAFIAQEMEVDELSTQFYHHDLKGVIGAGCLAHDVGNPAFGHSGEKAISNYFIQNADAHIGTSSLRSYFSDKEWSDLTDFEGNANALRVLTHHFKGKMSGGLSLTYTTLASILKYPCESVARTKTKKHRKKYGFFQSDKSIFNEIAKDTHMYQESAEPLSFFRHPFVYLVEAADDICYQIIDMEDAHRLKIISRAEVEHAFLQVIAEADRPENDLDKIKNTLSQLGDDNESVAYLRAKSINTLVMESADVFKANADKIIAGAYTSTLMDDVEEKCESLKAIRNMSIHKIYNHHSVIKVELAGYKVMSGLLETFVPGIINPNPSQIEEKSLVLLPEQFRTNSSATPYEKVLGVIDFVSGMTDDYAIEMYRNIMGIEIAMHSA